MNKPKQPSKDLLEQVARKYTYDRDRGVIINKDTGEEPKGLISYRYLGCGVKDTSGKWHTLRVHHIIWYFEHNEWPTDTLDHIDGNKLNNHYTNLRQCTQRENTLYYHQTQESSSKYTGVSWRKKRGIWKARVRYGGRAIQVKESVSEEACARAYDEFLIKVGLDPVNFSDYSDSKPDKEQ